MFLTHLSIKLINSICSKWLEFLMINNIVKIHCLPRLAAPLFQIRVIQFVVHGFQQNIVHCTTLTVFTVTPIMAYALYHVCSIYTLSQKNIPDIFDCNLKTNYLILMIIGTNISDKTCHQMTVQFRTSPNVCFCTT